MSRILVTGGAGFIGSAYVRHRLGGAHPGDEVRVLDKLTYAGRRENLEGIEGCELVEGDIADADAVRGAIEGCDAVVNFAAESHVDRSIESPGEFIQTDVFGTFVLLEAARESGIRHLQISTDEVYGSIEEGSFTESSPLDPSSPYSASKAGGDLLVGAYQHTYGTESVIVRASNNYGPRQHPEKLIPLCILNALAGDPLPVYGDGQQVRNWLWVEDFASAIDIVLERGNPGEAYNVGGPDERANLDVVKEILKRCDRDESLIEYVTDRPGHDRRYSLGSEKTQALGWEAQVVVRGRDRPRRRLVSRERDLVGADPLGRVPRVLRAPVRNKAFVSVTRIETEIPDLVLLEATAHGDERGFLLESFREDLWAEHGVTGPFVQENHSRSSGGILRGLHFQLRPGQAKLVRCVRGTIWDVAVDLRRDSPTFKRWEGEFS